MFHDHTELPADDDSSLVYPHLETFHSLHGTHTYCSDEVQSLPPNRSVECTYTELKKCKADRKSILAAETELFRFAVP